MSGSSFLTPAIAALALLSASTPALAAPKLSAKLAACSTGAGAAERFAVFTGSMPSAKHAARLRMRFVLERRAPDGGTWSRVAVPGFGVWMKSRPGVSGFVYKKRVEGLDGPADYRAVVHFRWIARDGGVVRSARRVTATCTQPDPRPNLVALLLRHVMRETGPVAELLVGNSGGGDLVTPTEVTLRIDGAEQASRSLPALPAGDTAVVTFPLSACPEGAVLDATIDPLGLVDEVLESDNRRRTTCSASARWTRSLHSMMR